MPYFKLFHGFIKSLIQYGIASNNFAFRISAGFFAMLSRAAIDYATDIC